jgi:hypothetical protein
MYNRNIVITFKALDQEIKESALMTDSVLKQILNLPLLVLSVIKLRTELM